MNIKLIMILIISTFVYESFAQVTLEWARRYTGTGNNTGDYAYAIAVDDSGNVYVTGSSFGGSNVDLTTIKYNSNGDSLWVRRWNRNPPGNESSYDIIVDDSGYIYVSGSSTLKYRSNGELVWEALNNGGALGGFVLDNSQNVYAGCTTSGFDYRTNKFNKFGTLVWTKIYNGPANDQDRIRDIALDKLGNVIVTGNSWGIGTQHDYATITYNPNGDTLWVRRYNGPALDVPTDIAYALAVDDSGNVYVTGRSDGVDENANCLTIKYSTLGDTLWIRRFSVSGSAGYDMKLDGSGNLYIGALTSGINYTVLKYTTNGALIWERTVTGSAFTPPPSLTIDNKGNIYLACSKTISPSRVDMRVLKYDSNGNLQWEGLYNGGSSNDINYPNAITVDSSGKVYITGQSYGSGTMYDYATVKFSQVIGLKILSNEIPKEFKLSQNYPNPFNPITNIKFQMHGVAFAKLIVFDVLGSEVATLVNEELQTGTYEIDFDGSNYASGIYFYKLMVDGSLIDSKKMILIK